MRKHNRSQLKTQLIKLRRIAYIILHRDSTPHEIAIGCASGAFAGLLPVFGLQMAIAVLIAMLFKRSSKLAAVLTTWITNPFTYVPVYFFEFWVGSFFYKNNVTVEDFRKMIDAVEKGDSFSEVMKVGANILIPLTIGTFIVASIGSVVFYFISYIFVKKWKEKKAKANLKS